MLRDRWNPRVWLRKWIEARIRAVLVEQMRPGGLLHRYQFSSHVDTRAQGRNASEVMDDLYRRISESGRQ